MDATTEEHMNQSLSYVKTMYCHAINRIEAIPKGEKLTQTDLLKHVAEKMNTTPANIYYFVKVLLKNYPNKVIKEKGIGAGIFNV